ncbi:MAG: hypothetical protein ABEJ40_11740 [Haloarculaceae archaeon]
MRGPKFDSSQDGKDALTTVHGISRASIDELFDEIDEAAPKLLEEYGVEGETDTDVVREYLKIACCEDIAWMADQGMWNGDEDVKRIVNEMNEYAGSNTKMMVGRVASRHCDMRRLSGAIMQETFSSE